MALYTVETRTCTVLHAPHSTTYASVTLVVDRACLGLPLATISMTVLSRLSRSLTSRSLIPSMAGTKEMSYWAFTLPQRTRPRSGRVRCGLRYAARPKCVRLQRSSNGDWQTRIESANLKTTRYQETCIGYLFWTSYMVILD